MSASRIEEKPSGAGHAILRAATITLLAGIAVKIVASGKEIAVASVFGRSDALDAFLAAMILPGLLINLFAETLNQALIPTLVRVREREGNAAAGNLLANAQLALLLVLILAALGMALGARVLLPVMGSHFSAEKIELAIQLFHALLPTVVLGGFAANCAAAINSCDGYAAPAMAQGLTPLALLLSALLWGRSCGIHVLVWASLAGAATQAIWMGAQCRQSVYGLRLRWSGSSAATTEVLRQYGPVLLSSLVANGGLLVDQSMAAMLASGSLATLAYAGRFTSVIMTLLASAASTALTPALARLAAHEDWTACRATMRKALLLAALTSVPFTLLLMLFAQGLIRLTLQHGAFTASDAAAVRPVLGMYALQIPFYVISRIPYRFLLAMRRSDLILQCGLLNLALDVALNLLLMRSMGVAGIALSTSLWTVATFLFLGWQSRRILQQAERQSQ
jgi:putative peptidoglycan lipid II flippase